jgi:two-component system, cell cycle sensor histidine kinase and response regulator CckA
MRVGTIRVAEDNKMVRKLTIDMLTGLGYQMLSAESPDRCIEWVDRHTGTIDLLATDIVMPGMNGRDFFERLRRRLPDLKVLFMSGCPGNVIWGGDPATALFL